MNRFKVKICCLVLLLTAFATGMLGCSEKTSDVTTIRVANWEEYIDYGDWDEEEAIELDDVTILGVNNLCDDFEEWYYETFGEEVKVEYSTFGTNEELYNQLTIGTQFDLVCPSEYMIMKMLREDMLVPFSEEFYDKSIETNYYSRNLSPYINSVFDELEINNQKLSTYAAGYMWGTLGLLYNSSEVADEDAAHWSVLLDKKYNRRVTIKDSVRDAYFGAIAYNYYDEITSPEFRASADYHKKLSEILNRTDAKTVEDVQRILTDMKNNVYSFETDSGKSDLVTGKVIVNEQWSGDAVYSMDQADEDGVELSYSVPAEGTNLWFDGWALLKDGIDGNSKKQQACEAFINFVSRPDNAIRNMYYIGYSSVISGTDSGLIFDYINWNYSAEDDEEDVMEYPIGYFFKDDSDEANEEFCVVAPKEQGKRQLFAQYPPKSVVDRAVVMKCFPEEENDRINTMWTNVRCFDAEGFIKKILNK